jgi:hypothetical protein
LIPFLMNRISRLRKGGLSSAACAILSAFALVLLAGCDRSENAADNSSPAEVQYGSKITFGKGGNSEAYKVTGWSTTEEKFTWSEGTSAQLRIPVPASDDPISLKMRIAALVKPPELPAQPVEVSINDQKIAEWQVGDTSEFVARVPPEFTKNGGVLNINIKTPKATSPKALGLSADPRVLGICCLELELAKS